MFKIERALTGLFEHLKLRSLGELPADMVPQVQPTVDLNPWAYKANGLQSIQVVGVQPVAGVGTVGSIYVQPRDWLVIGAQAVSISGGAGDLCLLDLGVQLRGSAAPTFTVAGSDRFGSNPQMTAGGAGELLYTNRQLGDSELFFVPQGSRWALTCHSYFAAVGPSAYAVVLAYEL